MPENMSALIAILAASIWFIAILVYCLNRKYGKAKTVKATVVHKQTAEVFTKYSGTGKAHRYYVTFQFGGKRKSFSVSEFSYNGYRIGESGTLKYKGNRLVDFR